MKKIIFISLTILFSLGAVALPSGPSDKIIDIFRQDFPNVQQQTIHDYGNYYMVYFKEDQLASCRVFYSTDGVLLGTIKYYDASKLDPFIRCEVKKKYHGKEIKGVTELTFKDVHTYEIVLQNSKGGCKVKYDDGVMTMVEKWFVAS